MKRYVEANQQNNTQNVNGTYVNNVKLSNRPLRSR